MDTGNTAVSYDVRYSTAVIDDGNFADATPVAQTLTPKAPGETETLVVDELVPATTYYFAVKSKDNADLVSDLSNVVTAETLIPDTTPPAAIADLQATDVHTRRLTVTWTAPADPDNGAASTYDIRVSTSPIDAGNFADATAVPQTLTPQIAGSAESLLIDGLAPGTTYYFAIKSADDPTRTTDGIANVSQLSNVLNQATLPAPTAPPAAIDDLAVTGDDAFSAALGWTAVADANNMPAVRYDIRYSTSEITDANWSAATAVLNAPAPQLPGTTETFTVQALQPDTTYYFAIKVTDEENNTSALSNVATVTTALLPPLPLVTTVQIIEKAGVTTANYPITLSMIFKKGDVPSNVIARVDGKALATQTDAKVHYDNGSVKHALVSFILPTLQANSEITVEFLAGGTNCNTTWMTRDQLLSTDIEANMAVTIAGQTSNVSARQILANMPQPQYWMKGSITTEFIVRDWNTNVANQLNVSYRVRVYATTGQIRVSTVVENCWINARGNITYDFALSLGLADPQVVFSKTDFTQWRNARWHRIFWMGSQPAEIQVKYNLPYMMSTGLLPQYDTSLVVPESTIAGAYTGWLNSAHDIMDHSIICLYFPTTGGRQEIGMYPTWAARYLLSMDNRMREITLNLGDLSGSIPIHFRETDPARSFYQHPLSVDDRPTLWISNPTWHYIAEADRLPDPIGDMTTPWAVDGAHQASFAYIPYLATGDLYYLEEMYFWASYDILNSDAGYRGADLGLIQEQVRGEAWEFRNLVDAASLAPDNDLERPYLIEKANNSITAWKQQYLPHTEGVVRTWGKSAADYREDGTTMDFSVASTKCAPWQDDFMLMSLSHAKDIGFDTGNLIDWLGTSLIGRFTDHPGWNRFRAAPYMMAADGIDPDTGAPAPFATWADVNNGWTDKVGALSYDNQEHSDGYLYIAHGALADVQHLTGGRAALTWLNATLQHQDILAASPTFAFVPRPDTRVPGDINGDGYVNVGDLQSLVAAWNSNAATPSQNWNASADQNDDGYINVGDLQILIANWGQ